MRVNKFSWIYGLYQFGSSILRHAQYMKLGRLWNHKFKHQAFSIIIDLVLINLVNPAIDSHDMLVAFRIIKTVLVIVFKLFDNFLDSFFFYLSHDSFHRTLCYLFSLVDGLARTFFSRSMRSHIDICTQSKFGTSCCSAAPFHSEVSSGRKIFAFLQHFCDLTLHFETARIGRIRQLFFFSFRGRRRRIFASTELAGSLLLILTGHDVFDCRHFAFNISLNSLFYFFIIGNTKLFYSKARRDK
ncbi:hypothetical protein D3C72_955000 [compost metagenome]